jgi:glutathione peroxidase
VDQSEVNGSNASAVFKYLKSQQGGILGSGIKWNFTKFLVDKQGRVVDRFAPTTTPVRLPFLPTLPPLS